MNYQDLKQKCIDLEHYETPQWAANAILKSEVLTPHVVDPCCGAGVLSKAALSEGATVSSYDVQDWGYAPTTFCDWLETYIGEVDEATCFMNPPFSLATQFVMKAINSNFRKIICFQRFAWYESQIRRDFWESFPPNRVYVCGDRAACWRHDIPVNERGKRYNPETGQEMSETPTAHAWFVWDRDQPSGTLLGRIHK